MKKCSKCKEIKELGEFGKNRTKSMGVQSQCKVCESEKGKKYYQKNKEAIKKKSCDYHNQNKQKIAKNKSKYYLENREYFSEKGKNYRENHKKEMKEYNRNYRENNRININKYFVNRKNNDMSFKISCNLRNRLNKALTRKFKLHMKPGSAIRDLGCSVNELVKHLEQQFRPGMNWNNYGKGKGRWNIDHIKALANVDLTDRKELLKVCHYMNLQPMWSGDNTAKGNRI